MNNTHAKTSNTLKTEAAQKIALFIGIVVCVLGAVVL